MSKRRKVIQGVTQYTYTLQTQKKSSTHKPLTGSQLRAANRVAKAKSEGLLAEAAEKNSLLAEIATLQARCDIPHECLAESKNGCEIDEFGHCVHCCECKECIKMLEEKEEEEEDDEEEQEEEWGEYDLMAEAAMFAAADADAASPADLPRFDYDSE